MILLLHSKLNYIIIVIMIINQNGCGTQTHTIAQSE